MKVKNTRSNVAIQSACFLILLVMLAPVNAIVNIESVRVSNPPDGWSGSVDLGIDGEDGNTNKQSTNVAGKLNLRQQQHSGFALLSRKYGKSNDVKDTDRTFAHLRYMYSLNETLTAEAFTQYQDDTFKRLTGRYLIGAGLRIRLHTDSDSDSHANNTANIFGIGAFRSEENYNSDVVSGERNENAWRANLYWVFKTSLNDNVSLANTIYVQPDFDDLQDFRALDQFALLVKMTDALSLKLSVDVTHDSEPPRLIDTASVLEKTDIVYGTTFVYAF